MNNVSKLVAKHNGDDPFNDEAQRKALKDFLRTDLDFVRFILDYAEIKSDAKPCDIIDDPLGEKRVDLGIIDKNSNVRCLVEVDYYFKWDPFWPKNYKNAHALERKIKYWRGKNIPYIGCTFSKNLDKMIVITDELITEFMHTKRKKWVELHGEWVEDVFISIPPLRAFKFGDWQDDELRRVS